MSGREAPLHRYQDDDDKRLTWSLVGLETIRKEAESPEVTLTGSKFLIWSCYELKQLDKMQSVR